MRIDDFQKTSLVESRDIPRELIRALSPLSDQVEQLTTATQGRISFSDNVNAEIRAVQLVHDTSTVIKQQRVKGAAVLVLVAWEELFDYVQIAWQSVDESRVRVKVKWASAPSGSNWVNLLIVGS